MIQSDFLSISELAARWEVSERQIIEHGLHQRLPLMFLFRGLAFTPAQLFLTGHGAATEQGEAEHLRTWIANSEALIRRNTAGLCDIYTSLDKDDVLRLRESITEAESKLAKLAETLETRETLRGKCEQFGYLRLPPRMIADLQQDGEIPFPYRAVAKDGQLMWLEPGSSGKWKERLRLSDLLIPIEAIRAIEAGQDQISDDSPSLIDQKASAVPVSRMRAQAAAILAEIARLGHDPQTLPKRISGKPWVRSEVWKALEKRADLFTTNSFKKAWEDLRASGQIAETQLDPE